MVVEVLWQGADTPSYRGVFHIAEVTSRLISHKDFIKLVESFGFHLEEHVRLRFTCTAQALILPPDGADDSFRFVPLHKDVVCAVGCRQGSDRLGSEGCTGYQDHEGLRL